MGGGTLRALFLSPHHDDESLFGAFSLLQYKPLVIVCLRSVKQAAYGVSAQRREAETRAAMQVLGCEWQQWSEPDVSPDPDALAAMMREADETHRPEIVFAPAVEEGGHEQHSLIGTLAAEVFNSRTQPYLTYRHYNMRTRSENEVPYAPEWVSLKLRALACYRSQIELESTRPWFMDDTLREYRP